jgi:hypothetical protein
MSGESGAVRRCPALSGFTGIADVSHAQWWEYLRRPGNARHASVWRAAPELAAKRMPAKGGHERVGIRQGATTLSLRAVGALILLAVQRVGYS